MFFLKYRLSCCRQSVNSLRWFQNFEFIGKKNPTRDISRRRIGSIMLIIMYVRRVGAMVQELTVSSACKQLGSQSDFLVLPDFLDE